jgi:predicted nucleic acid-binding protein
VTHLLDVNLLLAPNSGKTTDWYLANLANAHGMRLATLDKSVKHPAAEIVS